jgi:hypothetical protein
MGLLPRTALHSDSEHYPLVLNVLNLSVICTVLATFGQQLSVGLLLSMGANRTVTIG